MSSRRRLLNNSAFREDADPYNPQQGNTEEKAHLQQQQQSQQPKQYLPHTPMQLISHNTSFGTIIGQDDPYKEYEDQYQDATDPEYRQAKNIDDALESEGININPSKNQLHQQQQQQQPQQPAVKTNSLKLLVKFVEYLKAKGDSDPRTVLMLQERLLYTSAYLLEKGAKLNDLEFDFQSEAIQFVQKINLRAMENGSALSFDELLNLITKAIDILLYKPVFSRISPPSKVLELRILCFNNLSCIYRQKKMHQEALQAVECAIEIEEMLLIEQANNNESTEGNAGESRKNIASTYINKSVIMSELGMHLESIETIKHALTSMNEFRKQWEASLEEQDAFQLKYLSVIAYFNLAVEHEHLFYLQYAKTFYEIALNLSKELNYTEMTTNIQTALKKIQNTPKTKYVKP